MGNIENIVNSLNINMLHGNMVEYPLEKCYELVRAKERNMRNYYDEGRVVGKG